MFTWIKSSKQNKTDAFDNALEGFKRVYKQKILPLEEQYDFHDFHSPKLDDADFASKPMILLVGQCSSGKTTMIRYLLERDFPGMCIGPEPTTDDFAVITYSDQEGTVPGNATVVDANRPFRPLAKFGNAFLNRFRCSLVKSDVLKYVSIIDTPGILSGEKQRVDRGYDFTGVLEWFAERVDRIIILFDAHKLDISDEFRRGIEAFRGHDDKIRIVLNKADQVDQQELMRVYGALMWSLSRVLKTPEVPRVYIGSFWDQQLRYDYNRRLFEAEEQDLFRDLSGLPKNSALRKLNDLIKRARLAKVHAYIMANLYKDMPSLFGKSGKKKDLIKTLDKVYDRIHHENSISLGDFPDVEQMRQILGKYDWQRLQPLKPKLIEAVDKMLEVEIGLLAAMLPKEKEGGMSNGIQVEGGVFDGIKDKKTPFGFRKGEGVDAGAGEKGWIVQKDRNIYEKLFYSLGPTEGKLNGAAVKAILAESKLPSTVLGKIWKLSDIDQDGCLDAEEFALAQHLIRVKLDGYDLPKELPFHLLPPSKRP
ncbi:unnamed protein product [Cyprideis torosa]|uniref:Uncharacterized protein n=1 Tax=Cyprideis torosa TaxID=163714 RepID=A0A7R8W824_9CRUS|nr:unnamed protein product [Cyprideis torosa]CAG0883341.1 unnamed protein product [Cyprideis torosa]